VNEMVAYEPVISRAMRSLQPLVQLGNLRHMSPAELRQVIQTMNDRRDATLGAEPTGAAATASESSPQLPPVGDSARTE
jgi:hypothetical protein